MRVSENYVNNTVGIKCNRKFVHLRFSYCFELYFHLFSHRFYVVATLLWHSCNKLVPVQSILKNKWKIKNNFVVEKKCKIPRLMRIKYLVIGEDCADRAEDIYLELKCSKRSIINDLIVWR